MKKIMICAAVFCALCVCYSCQPTKAEPVKEKVVYTVEEQKALNDVYSCACQYLKEIDARVYYSPTAEAKFKIELIRQADLLDSAGDVIPENPAYDVIYDIVWPAGYPEQ